MRPVAKGSQPAVVKMALPLVVRSRISRLSDLPEPVPDVQRFGATEPSRRPAE